MDDYIGEILKQQQTVLEEYENLETVRRRLTEAAETVSNIVPQTGTRRRKHAGREEKTENGQKRSGNALYLQSLQKQLADGIEILSPQRTERAVFQARPAAETRTVGSGQQTAAKTQRTAKSAARSAAETKIQERRFDMTPEELSMFFQRDARRYS